MNGYQYFELKGSIVYVYKAYDIRLATSLNNNIC